MASVENPAEGLRESIARVDSTGDMVEEDDAALLPLLKGEVLDVDVPRSLRWLLGVSHHDGGLIVAIHHRWSVLFDAELVHAEFGRAKLTVDGYGQTICGHGWCVYRFDPVCVVSNIVVGEPSSGAERTG